MAEDVEALLARAGSMPYGEARTILVERALKEAEAGRDPKLIIQARFDLTAAYQHGGEPGKSFATFSRNVAAHDSNPGWFSEWHAWRLLWQFKWIMSDMRKFPEIPLRRALDALDDMERRYRIAGGTLHAVHAQRCLIAWHLGEEDETRAWLRRWETTPRDDLSDCEACDLSGRAYVLSGLGRDAEAVEAAGPVLAGEITCSSQPQGVLCTLLLPYVRAGRLEEAAAGHRRAYRLVQGKAGYLDDFGDHLEFLALTGNHARGLELLQRELPLLERAPSPAAALRFMSGAALVLRRLEETGHADLTVRRADRDVPVPELRAELESGARAIAARFDARNNGVVHTARLERTLAAEPLAEYLPLVPRARRDPGGDPEEPWRQARALREIGDHDGAVAVYTELAEGGALLEAAELLSDLDRDEEAAEAFDRAARLFDAEGDPLAAARALARHAKSVYYATDDGQEIMAAYDRARAALAAAGEQAAEEDLAALAHDEQVAREWIERQEG
ncbi:hypothetical protein ACIBHX_18990 [Nonomuraea sp. NPDC050536]|uniref:hypothetical protein n=1 Tax=Nonomuraea sp. NPDC050536 TaxID=3364366 RepID=UPI0037C8DFA2